MVVITVDLLAPHVGRTHPQTALAVQRTVDDHRLQSFGVLCNVHKLIKIALKMAVNARLQVLLQRINPFCISTF